MTARRNFPRLREMAAGSKPFELSLIISISPLGKVESCAVGACTAASETYDPEGGLEDFGVQTLAKTTAEPIAIKVMLT